jgi:branched-subunit amino acid aminotransferase/4-amino-4-deoxychorismate lyase
VLIWARGEIVPEAAFAVAVNDRVFEHGLGLFETLRTVRGAAPLLPRHRARMSASADALGLPLDRAALPDIEAIDALLAASGITDDAMLRITLSGGTMGSDDAVVWMRATPLPPPPLATGFTVDFAPWTMAAGDPLARHKTLNYWSRRLAYEHGRARGADEVLCGTPDGRYWEGSRTNLFLVVAGSLHTTTLEGPVLPGIMRGLVLELAPSVGLSLAPAEPGFAADALAAADEVFLTNSVRGVVPVGRLPGRALAAPGLWTARLRECVDKWLDQGG